MSKLVFPGVILNGYEHYEGTKDALVAAGVAKREWFERCRYFCRYGKGWRTARTFYVCDEDLGNIRITTEWKGIWEIAFWDGWRQTVKDLRRTVDADRPRFTIVGEPANGVFRHIDLA